MKTIRTLLVALLPFICVGNAPAETKPLPWLVAQSRTPSCELDGRKVPSGTRLCMEKSVWQCGARGSWENTGEAC